MNAHLNQYRQQQFDSATPEQILIMLYDGAIRFCRQSLEAMAAGELTAKREAISRAMAIIAEFSNSLDRNIGGDTADNLDALYHFMMRELTSANLHDDPEKVTVVLNLLRDLRETWIQAISIARQDQNPADPVDPAREPKSLPQDHRPLKMAL